MTPRPKVKFSAGHYLVLGEMINQIADPAERQRVADHFATCFHGRSRIAFDAYQWNRKTGGKVDPSAIK